MTGPFIHDIDPVLADVGGLYLWYYGLFYSLGFLAIFLWLRIQRHRLRFSLADVYDLTIVASVSILIGGRLMAVVFYEWDYYREHLWQILYYWIGGMGTHGFLIGVVAGTWLFCRVKRRPFLEVLDALAIPGAVILGFGRLANFIDGQIVGSVTDAWWAVKFPDAEGYRHPVVLYDGFKNLLLVIPLLLIQRANPRPGVLAANFILWYGLFRFLIDFLRDYRAELLGLPSGQWFNVSMVVIGAGLLAWVFRRPGSRSVMADIDWSTYDALLSRPSGLVLRRLMLAAILLFSLGIPSDRTQDVPAAYGKRHPGLEHSALYPPVSIRRPDS
jgi:phosphatidylglycerol:prolipoprotein diacylglycerol transferase